MFRHIDSDHKLIKWRLVIHSCIDGLSGLIIYLHCCNSNRPETVRNLFQEKVEGFYWPCRVRSDQGMENIGVARLMLDKFGPENGSYLTGLSVHNQRMSDFGEMLSPILFNTTGTCSNLWKVSVFWIL